MTCPVCQDDLAEIDYFGIRRHAEHYYTYPQSWIERQGGVYRCRNEECERFDETCWAYDRDGELHEGSPT